MNPENPEVSMDEFTAENEIGHALADCQKGDWPNVEEDLREFGKKAGEGKLTPENKGALSEQLGEIKTAFEAATDVPEENREKIAQLIKEAEKIIAE